MMKYDLQIKGILTRANYAFRKNEIVSRDYTGLFRYNYGQMYQRVCQLAHVLDQMGIEKGDRVGTLAWNNHRHLEIYFAAPCTGAIMHTINMRLFTDQLIYVINHAEDKIIFVDPDLVPLLEPIQSQLTHTKAYIILGSSAQAVPNKLANAHYYEDLLTQADTSYDFPDLDEETPSAICYTTATTGNPKGVVYSHRAVVLHSFASALKDSLGISEADTLMPMVPMFHVNAWGLPYTATMVGAKLVLPGSRPDPAIICQLLQDEKVTLTAGVPTIWMMVLAQLQKQPYDLSSLEYIINGGAPLPQNLLVGYDKLFGLKVANAYGMTETTPLVTCCKLKKYMYDLPEEQKVKYLLKQGLLVAGLEMRVIDENGQDVPHDGQTMGELVLKGPWITDGYYKEPERTKEAFTPDGWFRTNDIVTIDDEGYVHIADRVKDLIKSGGEWISSVDLENAIMLHPAVAEASVIAMPSEKWDERPMAVVVLKESAVGEVQENDILDFLKDKVAKLWMPDKVVFADEIPKTSVGKFNKKALRARFTGELAN